jgi:glycerol-3-phosphate dehydrogenase
MADFSQRPAARSSALDLLEGEPFDLLVIGGGIVGAGVARDAAMRGIRVALVDQSDFASGTSSRSSRLLHGGIRYLAQGRLPLVREASREKRVLGRIAPHLAEPLAFIFPTSKHTQWSRWKLAIGVKLYDLLCGTHSNFGRSRVLSRSETTELLPGVTTQDLTGAVRYFDALTNDARLVLDTIRSAGQYGALALNYVRLVNAEHANGLWHCELAEGETQRSLVLDARTVVNATGPWSDRIPNSSTSLRLTKGIHLVIDRSRLPVPDAVVMAQARRILFAIPWGERVILGTTDTDYDGALDNPTCDAADMQYVLDVTNETFPSAGLTATDVVSSWAGLRPLVADANGNPSDISRRHEVTTSRPGWWDITGGKLTTYRLMAEEAVSAIAKYLAVPAAQCQTASTLLLDASHVRGVSGILPPAVSAEAVRHFCRYEWARHLDDVMIRRTSWRHYHREHLNIAAQVAQWMADELAWQLDDVSAELSRYRRLVGAYEEPDLAMSGNGHPADKTLSITPVQAVSVNRER